MRIFLRLSFRDYPDLFCVGVPGRDYSACFFFDVDTFLFFLFTTVLLLVSRASRRAREGAPFQDRLLLKQPFFHYLAILMKHGD
jgi:hypothetical protein